MKEDTKPPASTPAPVELDEAALLRIERARRDLQRSQERADEAFHKSFPQPIETDAEYLARVQRETDEYQRHLQECEAMRMRALRDARKPRAPRGNGSEPAVGTRDAIRRQQPGQRRGPPEPEPLVAAIDGVMRALAVLREQTIAASSVPPTDDWIGQRESPIPPRCHTRLCRKLMAEGDDRSAVTGRNHLLRRSALDEYLRGMPGRTAATAPHTAANPLSPWEQVKRKWAEAGLQ